MSKFNELKEKRANLELEYNVDRSKLNEEIDELEKEFERKIKAPFRGVKVKIDYSETHLLVGFGEKPVRDLIPVFIIDTVPEIALVEYSKNKYKCNTDIITSELGEKLRDIHIEYFGKL